MKKKRIILFAAIILVIAGLLTVAYLAKGKDAPAIEEKQPPVVEQSYIPAPAAKGVAGPVFSGALEDVWEEDEEESYNGFTTRAQLGEVEGSIGVLTVDKIGVSCHVYDSDENTVMEDMKRGAAHYRSTSYWDGNIGFSAHIGKKEYCYFDRLHELKAGDIITYETSLGQRSYAVSHIAKIADDDWSLLERTEDNRLTLTTCIDGKPEQRLCVQAVECPPGE